MLHLISNVLKFSRSTVNKVALEPKILTKKNFSTSKNMSAQGSDYIVWVDLEMSGLNIEKDHILEMACLITDKNLNMVAERSEIIIKQEDSVLDGMDEWCTKTHGKSGLTQAVKDSEISLEMAETIMLEFLQKHVPPKTCPLAGNSIYMDRMFLNKYMKRFNDYLHYRIIDVSTIKELNFRWYPENKNLPRKKLNHRALDDIKESIAELKFYRETIFKSQINDN